MALYEVQTFSDPENKTVHEQKHVPFIQAPEKVKKGEYFQVSIKMGEGIDHPMEPGHFIQYVDLYADYYHLERVNFTPETKAEAVLTIKLEKSCTLRAFELCNLHGQWEGTFDIIVEE
ncbi:MAG: desulfoferrodoxin [Halanaerobiaceae bacterium]|jgi:superoxide reductase|nr:desulfoferrodoxin [Halanaerobiaceae bacterium]